MLLWIYSMVNYKMKRMCALRYNHACMHSAAPATESKYSMVKALIVLPFFRPIYDVVLVNKLLYYLCRYCHHAFI